MAYTGFSEENKPISVLTDHKFIHKDAMNQTKFSTKMLDLHQKILNLPNTRIENLSTKPHSPQLDINLACSPHL